MRRGSEGKDDDDKMKWWDILGKQRDGREVEEMIVSLTCNARRV